MRRFTSIWIHFLWLYRMLDVYYPFSTVNWNTATLFLYGLVAACDYANEMYPVWHTRLHSVGEDVNVADKFSLLEFAVAYLAGVASAYWFLDTHVSPVAWLCILTFAWIGHFALIKVWDRHLSRLRYAAYGHVP